MQLTKRLALSLLIFVSATLTWADERKSSSLYVDTLALPLMLISESEIGFYGIGLGADWHLNDKTSIGTSLNQWGYIDALAVSRLALRGHYYFSGYMNSGFYSTLSLAHWKATETAFDCTETLSEMRFGAMAGYQARLGESVFTRIGFGATTGQHTMEPCSQEEMGSNALAEIVVGYSF